MTYDEYEPMITRLIALFPQRPIAPATVAAYWELLRDLDAGVFRLATEHCAKTCDWFPTVKQLRRAADEIAAARIPDPMERMRQFPHLVENQMIRSLVSLDLSDIADELEAGRGSRTRLSRADDDAGDMLADPRRRDDGERRAKPHLLPAPRRAQSR